MIKRGSIILIVIAVLLAVFGWMDFVILHCTSSKKPPVLPKQVASVHFPTSSAKYIRRSVEGDVFIVDSVKCDVVFFHIEGYTFTIVETLREFNKRYQHVN